MTCDGDSIFGLLKDTTDPARLTDEELGRQLTDLGRWQGETADDIAGLAAIRLRQLNIEHRRRSAIRSY